MRVCWTVCQGGIICTSGILKIMKLKFTSKLTPLEMVPFHLPDWDKSPIEITPQWPPFKVCYLTSPDTTFDLPVLS